MSIEILGVFEEIWGFTLWGSYDQYSMLLAQLSYSL